MLYKSPIHDGYKRKQNSFTNTNPYTLVYLYTTYYLKQKKM